MLLGREEHLSVAFLVLQVDLILVVAAQFPVWVESVTGGGQQASPSIPAQLAPTCRLLDFGAALTLSKLRSIPEVHILLVLVSCLLIDSRRYGRLQDLQGLDGH